MNGTSSVSRAAYYSMEVVLNPAMPTDAGGLDILAGYTLRFAATSACRCLRCPGDPTLFLGRHRLGIRWRVEGHGI